MIRVHVICEGQTEEMFINEVLYNEYYPRNIFFSASKIGRPGHQGGNVCFERLLFDLRECLLRDSTVFCSTFIDFYGSSSDFPGKREAGKFTSVIDKASCVTEALRVRLEDKLGPAPLRRFIPYIQMYEFEGLLFSETDRFASGIDKPDLAKEFQKIRDAFNTPEEINDDPQTAPSKRIKKIFPGYNKPFHGSIGALEIGLDTIRKECPLFNAWLKQIESLAEQVQQ